MTCIIHPFLHLIFLLQPYFMKTSPWTTPIHSEGCTMLQGVNVPRHSYVPLIVLWAREIMQCTHPRTHVLVCWCFYFNGIDSRSGVSGLKNAHIFSFSRCCTWVSTVAITLHTPRRQEHYLPFKVQEAKVQTRSGMCSSSPVAELQTKLRLPGFQASAFPTQIRSLPKWLAPVRQQPDTCISGQRAVFLLILLSTQLAVPSLWPIGPQLLGLYDLQHIIDPLVKV